MSFNILKHTKPLEEEFDSIRRELTSLRTNGKKEYAKIAEQMNSDLNQVNNSLTNQQTINANLTNQIDAILNEPDAPAPTEYYVPITGTYIFGDGLTEGDWRIIVDGTKLQFQRLESSIWVSKGTFA